MSLKRKEFMEQEAKLYYNVYDEVTRVVGDSEPVIWLRQGFMEGKAPVFDAGTNIVARSPAVARGVRRSGAIEYERDLLAVRELLDHGGRAAPSISKQNR